MANTGSTESKHHGSAHLQVWVFIVLVILAVGGVAVTMMRQSGGWGYWIFLAIVYGATSVALSMKAAKESGQAVWAAVSRDVFLWVGVLVSLKILFVFELTGIMNREAVSYASLVVLAFACYAAGLFVQWGFFLIGLLLAVIVVVLAYFELYLVWLFVVPAALGAVWVFYVRGHRRAHR